MFGRNFIPSGEIVRVFELQLLIQNNWKMSKSFPFHLPILWNSYLFIERIITKLGVSFECFVAPPLEHPWFRDRKTSNQMQLKREFSFLFLCWHDFTGVLFVFLFRRMSLLFIVRGIYSKRKENMSTLLFLNDMESSMEIEGKTTFWLKLN